MGDILSGGESCGESLVYWPKQRIPGYYPTQRVQRVCVCVFRLPQVRYVLKLLVLVGSAVFLSFTTSSCSSVASQMSPFPTAFRPV